MKVVVNKEDLPEDFSGEVEVVIACEVYGDNHPQSVSGLEVIDSPTGEFYRRQEEWETP